MVQRTAMQLKASDTKPDATTGSTKLAAIPSEHERRFESDKELKAFLDSRELLRRLPISRCTLHNWRRQKKIPSIVIGRRVLFCWESVASALRRLERGGGGRNEIRNHW
jgi:hypothetical protein